MYIDNIILTAKGFAFTSVSYYYSAIKNIDHLNINNGKITKNHCIVNEGKKRNQF